MSFSMKFRIMNVSLFPPIQAKNNSGRNALIRVNNQDQRLHFSLEFRDEYHFFTLLISCCPKDVSGNYLDFKQYFKRIVFNYKKTWKHSNASHSIMHGYTHGRYIILKSRRFSIELNKHKNFNNEHSGFQHVMDNVFCKAAGGGWAVSVHHNTLLFNDIQQILKHPIFSTTHAAGYLNSLVSVIGILIWIRPSAH